MCETRIVHTSYHVCSMLHQSQKSVARDNKERFGYGGRKRIRSRRRDESKLLGLNRPEESSVEGKWSMVNGQ